MFKAPQRVVYQVADLAKAKEWYRTVLEREPAVDMPFFVGFAVGEAMLCLVPCTAAPADIAKQYLTLSDGSPAGKTLPFFSFTRASVLA
jgi:hypothetical protein